MTELVSVAPDINRDRWGRPLITPPNGGKPVAYTRATTLAGAIDDLNGLITWKIGRAVTGLVDRPDLLLSAAAHRDDKKKLYKICDDALEAGGASAAATIGTAVHSLTELIDRGQTPGNFPDAYRADITAYETATRDLERLHVEQMLVVDELQVAGTPDLIVRYDGENYIADKKTGSIDFPHKMAAQLAIYAHGQMYDPATGRRTPLPAVNGQRGIIIHLPAGEGRCTLHWINIAAGWEAVQLAVKVRDWRKHRGLLEPFDTPADDTALGTDPILTAVQSAATAEDLVALWTTNQDTWRLEHTQAAARRKAQLAQTA